MKPRHAIALALLLPLPALAENIVTLGFSPANTLLSLGQSAFIDITGHYSGGGNVLGGAVNLSFDSSVIEVLNVTLKAPDDIAGEAGSIDNPAGSVSGIAFASFGGVAGDFTLATLEVRGVGLGTSSLNVSDANDPIYEWWNDVPPFGKAVTVLAGVGSITVAAAPVPEPETWAMLLAGLGLTGLLLGRRMRT